ncbi:hypothetical protein BX600DRAFT_443842 [Xylariales sp. PMI_506]|nr:hypothetical protein BX600DRAFT_443842 [Xylariales sp. PMI_506]
MDQKLAAVLGMGSQSSKDYRRCGICYFELSPGTPFLHDPIIARRLMPKGGVWTDGPLDLVLTPTPDSSFVQFRTKLCAIKTSADRSCTCCAAIWKNLGEQLRFEGAELDDKCMQAQCDLYWLVGSDRKSHVPSLQVGLLAKAGGDFYKKLEFAMIIGYAGPGLDHPAARRVSKAVAEGYTGSPRSLKALKFWLQGCEKTHPACKLPDSILPDRVLEITRSSKGDLSIRLVQASGKHPYACLSHRWDSLCIIQDDNDDWKAQAGQMCRIYQGSYVTLAATSSNDSDSGLFMRVPTIPIPTRRASRHGVFIRKETKHVNFSVHPMSVYDKDFPLMARGWVYQERLLSPRLVHFSRYELSLQCANAYARCECGQNDFFFRKKDHLQSLKEPKISEVRRVWHGIVLEYSALRLTFPTDCLAALAGIARQYGTAHTEALGQYVAGLWEKTLVYDMIWLIQHGAKYKRPERYCAPTWSWASTSAEVWTLSTYARVTDDLEVVEFAVEMAGPDEYGPIAAGEITLRGYLAPGTLHVEKFTLREDGQDVHYSRPFFQRSESPNQYIYIDSNFDCPDETGYIPPGAEIYSVKTGFVGDGNHVCLVLMGIEDRPGVFRRIGLMQDTKREEVNSWFDDKQLKELIKVI